MVLDTILGFFRYDEGTTIIPYSHLFTDNNHYIYDNYGPYGVISYWYSYTQTYGNDESRPYIYNRKIIFVKNNNNLKLNKEININLPSSSSINFIDNYGYLIKSSTLLSDNFDLSNTISLTDSIENIYINNSNINLYSIPNIQFIYDLYITDDFDGDINVFIYQIYDNNSYEISNSSSLSILRYLDGSINKNKLSGNFNITYDLSESYKLSIKDSNNKILSILTLDENYLVVHILN